MGRWNIGHVRGGIAGGLDLVGGSPPVGNRSAGKNITEIIGGSPPVGNPVQPT
jgi:hypothetical protein